jgi:hypothetical protein
VSRARRSAGAIGAAKQLVEATAKVVVTERLPIAADVKFLNSSRPLRRRCNCIRPRESPDWTAPRRSRRSSAACHRSRSVWRSSAIAAMAPGTARAACRQDSARGVRIWLSMPRSPGASCSSTHWPSPRRRGSASGLTSPVGSSKRSLMGALGQSSDPMPTIDARRRSSR